MEMSEVIMGLVVLVMIGIYLLARSRRVKSKTTILPMEDPPTFSSLEWKQYADPTEYGTDLMEKPEGYSQMKHGYVPWGKTSRMEFSNGYGLSVVRHHGSYGGDSGFYEAAVLKCATAEDIAGIEEENKTKTYKSHVPELGEWILVYDTEVMPIDVVGWLSEDEVTIYLQRVWLMNEDGTEKVKYIEAEYE